MAPRKILEVGSTQQDIDLHYNAEAYMDVLHPYLSVAAKSNIDVIQRFQSKVLRMISAAPWYISNSIIHHDLNIPTVQAEIRRFCERYKDRLENHSNLLARDLLNNEHNIRRLQRRHIFDI